MSATLVEYPRKPNELADDIESFVYVITLAILRFHRTSLEDKTLSAHISMTYHNALRTPDGYYVGSKEKLKNIRAGNPGFEMLESTSSLALLLDGLWKLGREHYATLDHKDLETRWGVKPVREPRVPASPYKLHHPRADKMEPRRIDIPTVQPTDAPQSLALHSPISKRLRDFRSHKHILQIFDGLYEGLWIPQTKVGDLFENLHLFLEVRSTGSTGTIESSSMSGSSN